MRKINSVAEGWELLEDIAQGNEVGSVDEVFAMMFDLMGEKEY